MAQDAVDFAAVAPLLPARSGFIAVLRPALRLAQVAGVADPCEQRRWMRRAVFGSVGDLALARLLSGSAAEFLGVRLALDVVDVATWATCDPRSAASALMLNAPLNTEVAVRRTPKGAGLLALGMVVVSAVSRRRHQQKFNPFDVIWAMIGPVTGWVWRLHERAEIDAVRAQYRDIVSARTGGARLAGQREVAMAADSVIDLLCRTIPMIDSHHGGVGLRGPLAQWKADVAEASRASGAMFLGDFFLRWQAVRNGGSVVSEWVWPDVGPDIGTVLLHPMQAASLWAALDDAELSGRFTVGVENADEARSHDGRRDVVVDGQLIQLAAPTEGSSRWRIEPTPVALVIGAFWAAVTADKRRYGVSRVVAGAGSAAYLVAAIGTQRAIRTDRLAGKSWAVGVTSSLSGVFAVLAGWSSRDSPSRGPQLAATGGANTIGLISGIWSDEFEARDRFVVAAGSVVTLVSAWVFSSRPRSLTRFAAEMMWPLVAFAAAKLVPDALASHATGVVETLERNADDAVADAATAGRDDARGIVERVVRAAREALESNRLLLDERLAAEADARIRNCEREVAKWTMTRETHS